MCGVLNMKMKDDGSEIPYLLHLFADQAAVTRPGTFLQLIIHQV
jgi:hypothetical protein